MRISGAFPSDYLKAADLDGKPGLFTMSHVEMKDIGGDHKPCLYFKEVERGLILNKTNANNIAAAYGDDTDAWRDQKIVLFEAMVDFQGKTVPAIRVRMPKPQAQTVRQSSADMGRAPPRRVDDGMDDAIPF